MNNISLFSPEIFTLIILPLLIFFARICDVTMGTIRIIFVSRGKKFFAPLLGFFEILIWLLAIGQIMQNLTNVACYVAYAGGYATGTFVGMYVEEKLAMGVLLIRTITRKDASELIKFLRAANYGVTSVDAQGVTGKVNVIFTIVKRSELEHVVEIIKRFNPKAFYSIEDVRFATNGVFPLRKHPNTRKYLRLFRMRRKEK
ncbi:MAG: hypothetical protein AMJ45_04725 [Syntrophobacter sp. DG_60]|nr:MAG: hypothetical protein AMJ45_04725 [Syntrophobacter sp. DG_60]